MNDREHMPRLSRRRALRVLAGASGLMLGGAAAAQRAASGVAATGCVLTPAQAEGPYFVDERLNRADVRADQPSDSVSPGALLSLDLGVAAVSGGQCAPLRGAMVDIWQCDALGNYSDVDRMRGRHFLRGYQTTDVNGRVQFTTIYPGAYLGRAVHIHFKVRATDAGKRLEFTSQLYFDDRLTDRVHAVGPYAGSASRRTRNEDDGLYRDGGRGLTLDVRQTGSGYTAAYDIGVGMA